MLEKHLIKAAKVSSNLCRSIQLKLELAEEFQKLSPREKECLLLLSTGYAMKEAASKLCLSPRTVEQHLYNIKHKMKIHSKNAIIKRVFH